MIKSGFAPYMSVTLSVSPIFRPVLDPEFVPASLWNRAYRVARTARPALSRSPSRWSAAMARVSVFRTAILPHEGPQRRAEHRYAERLLKFLLWQKGGYRVTVAGDPRIAGYLRGVYSPGGARAFDYDFMGDRVYGQPMTIESVRLRRPRPKSARPPRRWAGIWTAAASASTWAPATANAPPSSTARSSSAKRSPWNPSAQADPQYHYDGINDSLRRAAAHLPRVDAIGGSAAGVYVDNEVRVGSLYRGVPRDAVRHAHPPPVLRPARRPGAAFRSTW